MRPYAILLVLLFLNGCIGEGRPSYDNGTMAALSSCRAQTDILDSELCIRGLAMEKDDISICDEIEHGPSYAGNVRDVCVIDFAKERRDESLCERVERKEEKGFCYGALGSLKLNLSLCDMAAGHRDACYAHVALSTDSVSLCRQVTDEGTKSWCLALTGTETGDASACDDINVSGVAKDWCYLDVALTTGDGSLCDKIGYSMEGYYRDACFNNLNRS